MNAHGTASRVARMAGAIAALLLAHTAVAADHEVVVYGKRIPEIVVFGKPLSLPGQPELAPLRVDSARFVDGLHSDIRAGLVRAEKDKSAAGDVKLAALGPRSGG